MIITAYGVAAQLLPQGTASARRGIAEVVVLLTTATGLPHSLDDRMIATVLLLHGLDEADRQRLLAARANALGWRWLYTGRTPRSIDDRGFVLNAGSPSLPDSAVGKSGLVLS